MYIHVFNSNRYPRLRYVDVSDSPVAGLLKALFLKAEQTVVSSMKGTLKLLNVATALTLRVLLINSENPCRIVL